MTRVLITGMSGAGKTTVLNELARRGHHTVDTDYDGWTQPDGLWNESRMDQLLADHPDLISGTVEPLLRRGATLELDGEQPVDELADAIENMITRIR